MCTHSPRILSENFGRISDEFEISNLRQISDDPQKKLRGSSERISNETQSESQTSVTEAPIELNLSNLIGTAFQVTIVIGSLSGYRFVRDSFEFLCDQGFISV